MRTGVFLSEVTITKFLTEVVEDLQAAQLDQAEIKLDALAFERLTTIIRGHGKVIDPAAGLGGAGRARETGVHVSACEHAVKGRDVTAALYQAEIALACWTERRGE